MRRALATVTALVMAGGPTAAALATAGVAVRAVADVQSGTTGVDGVVLLGAATASTLALAWLAIACTAGVVLASTRLLHSTVSGDGPAAAVRWSGARAAGVPALVCAAVLAVAGPAAASPGWDVVVTAETSSQDPSDTGTGPARAGAGTGTDGGTVGGTTARGWVPQVSPVPPAATALVTSSPAAPDPAGTGAPRDATRVVRQGDSLWSIAAERLGPGATAAEVAAEWPRWWQRNRDAVGDDPDVLRPGQVLHVP